MSIVFFHGQNRSSVSLAFPRSGGFDMSGATASNSGTPHIGAGGFLKTIGSDTYYVEALGSDFTNKTGTIPDTYPSWRGFINNPTFGSWNGAWYSDGNGGTAAGALNYLDIVFPTAQTFTSIRIAPSDGGGEKTYPSAFVVQGGAEGNTGGTGWTTLFAWNPANPTAGEADLWVIGQYRQFIFTQSGAFRRYRLGVSRVGYNTNLDGYVHRVFGNIIYEANTTPNNDILPFATGTNVMTSSASVISSPSSIVPDASFGYSQTINGVLYRVFSASQQTGFELWRGFNNSATDYWGPTATTNNFVQIDLGSPQTAVSLTIILPADGNNVLSPNTFTVSGSNNADMSSPTTLLTVTGRTTTGSGNSTTTAFTTTGSFRYYRINITQTNNGGGSNVPRVANFVLNAV